MWFWLTVLAGTASAGHHLVDRYVLRDGKDPIAFAFLFELLQIILILPVLPFDFKATFEAIPMLLLFLTGMIEILTMILFVNMHKYVEVSISSIIMRLRTVWVVLLAYLFLGERLTVNGVMGTILVLAGLSVVSLQKFNKKAISSSKALIFPFLFSLTTAIETTLMKNAAKNFSASWVLIVVMLPSVIILPMISRGLIKKARKFFKAKSSWVFLASFLGTVGFYTFQQSLHFGDVSRIMPIYQSLSILTVFGGIFLLKERKRIWQKILGGILAVIGVILVKGG